MSSLVNRNEVHVVFTNMQKLFDDSLPKMSSDFIIFSGVTPRSFANIMHERDERGRSFRLYYKPDLKTLHVTVPSGPHERATAGIGFPITVVSKTVSRRTGNNGAKWYSSINPSVRGGKEPDFCFVPLPPRTSEKDWPTLVIETGYSESLARLRDDMHWWFGASNHQVKIVLLIDLDKNNQTIGIYKYTEDWPIPPGASVTRVGNTLTNPTLRHTNFITPIANRSPAIYEVDRTDLILEFELLFLRPPVPGTSEADIVITVDDLKLVAEETWTEL